MQALIKQLAPPVMVNAYHSLKRQLRRKSYDKDAIIGVGNFQLIGPSNHILHEVSSIQPYRNHAIGVVARCVAETYPNSCIIDAGANIGDTAAIIASYCRSPIICIEPSSIYLPYLQKNISQFPNETEVHSVFLGIDDGEVPELTHGRGTARVKIQAESNTDTSKFQYASMEEISRRRPVSLVKIDIDGLDYKVINTEISFLSKNLAVIYFEIEVNTAREVIEASKTLKNLWAAGYRNFLVWDDAGFFVSSVESLECLIDLVKYVSEPVLSNSRRPNFGLNVAAFPCDRESPFEKCLMRSREFFHTKSNTV